MVSLSRKQEIVVLSNHQVAQSKLVKIVFTPILGDISPSEFTGDDMILSEIKEDGNYNHLGTYSARFNSVTIHPPIGDVRGARTGYLLTTILQTSIDRIDRHVKQTKSASKDMYRWEDLSDFSTDSKPDLYR